MVIASFMEMAEIWIREGKMFIKDESKVASSLRGTSFHMNGTVPKRVKNGIITIRD